MTILETTTLPAGLSTGVYAIDPTHSEVGFTTRHAMITKVRGSFTQFSGNIVLDPDPTNSSVNVLIDVSSVDTRNTDRDNHLRSSDFFDVENFPQAHFVSKEVIFDDDTAQITGDFTLHGITRTVVLKVQAEGQSVDPFGNTRAGFSAETEINRKDFDLTWNAALETGGMLVSDKIKITLDISAIKQ